MTLSKQTEKSRVRLNAFIARAGVCSRRAADVLISDGKVAVNDTVVTVAGTTIDPAVDTVSMDGRKIAGQTQTITVMLHKPDGVVSTCISQRGQRTVRDLIDLPGRLYPVGRLDKDSSGLLLLTNDGQLALELTHPRYAHEKEYEVKLDATLDSQQFAELKRGVMLDGEYRRPRSIVQVSPRMIRVVLTEGRKRHIRRMVAAVGRRVVSLKRTRIGALALGDLAPGAWRVLTSPEITKLKK